MITTRSGRRFGVRALPRTQLDLLICPGWIVLVGYGSRRHLYRRLIPSFGRPPALQRGPVDRLVARLATKARTWGTP